LKKFSEGAPGADTVLSSREFQIFITLSEKKCWHRSVLNLLFINLYEWPLVHLDESRVNIESNETSDKPFNILLTSIAGLHVFFALQTDVQNKIIHSIQVSFE